MHHPAIFIFKFIAFFLIALGVNAQSLPLGFSVYEESLRRRQLLGDFDSLFSFNLRPVYFRKGDLDSTLRDKINWEQVGKKFINDIGYVELLPFRFTARVNSSMPYGWNDESMIPSKGLQSYLSVGGFIRLGVLTIQLRPEVVWSANQEYQRFPRGDEALLKKYYDYQLNRADIPERFGEGTYTKVLPGQSYVGLNAGPVFLGISSENLWWGPGRHNALIISNNAPGFYHATLKTTRPLRTGIGAFETQLLAGKLEDSRFLYPEKSYYAARRNDWRYLSAILINYSPKWVEGLHVGGARVVQQYFEDTKKFKDYYSIFSDLFRQKSNFIDEIYNRDHLLSLFIRWRWSKAASEFYFEFGRNDASYNLRDFIMTPEHSRAYIFGITKLIPSTIRNGHIQINAELTQLQQSSNQLIRDAKNWYTHHQVRHGFTHMGQVLGAGIGSGSNLQSLEVSWVSSLDKVGLLLERRVNNNDFHYFAFSDDSKHKQWVDIGVNLLFEKQIRGIMLSTKIAFVNSLNYQWQFAAPHSPNAMAPIGLDKFNFHGNVNLIYHFRNLSK